jgi:uncharacterized membrane protein
VLIIKRKSKLRVLCAAVVSFFLVNAVDIHIAANGNQGTLNIGQSAQARRGGGRSGGGSFRSAPSRSSPSRSSRSSGSDYSGGRYSSGSNVYVVPGGTVYSYSPMPLIVLVIILGILAIAIRSYINSTNSANHDAITSADRAIGNSEIDNNIVTISKIQVGLLAQARAIQTQLSEYSLNTDTKTPEGLAQLLQEAALALLRTPENWMHVLASSKTVRSREEAQAIFNQLSIQERSKFSAESLTNVNGIRRIQDNSKQDNEPGSYIVVTLLIGTENDRPLFGDVYSAKELQQALERIAATPPEYLTVFELLWTPQSETESLTYDELLTEYTNLMQIA